MRKLNIVLAGLAMCLYLLLPAAVMAQDDELEVTMEVLDSVEDIDGDVIVMPGPGDGFAGESDRDDGGVADLPGESGDEPADGPDDDAGFERDFADAETEDDFTHDEDFESGEDEEEFERESDFDEGDDVDLDIPDEAPMDDEEPMDEEEQVEGDSVFEDDLVSVVAES